MFNHRRLSSDSRLIERILDYTKDKKIWMNNYSSALFSSDQIKVSEDFLALAGEGEYCFVENQSLTPFSHQIEKIVIYRWNRRYPSDFKFDHSILAGRKLIRSLDFKGSSHPKMTEEIYQ